MLLVIGGAGFIGSNFVLSKIAETGEPIVSLDKLTYAGNPDNLSALNGRPEYLFVRGDICDRPPVRSLLYGHPPRAVVHFAAESHDSGPPEFVKTNVVGMCSLLEGAKQYWEALESRQRAEFRFLHVSTDEVYGSLGPADPAFTERTPYGPHSPYAAPKAAGDHLVRAYHHTYGMPTLTTDCSNNYGPYQFLEKLIPLVIHDALAGTPLCRLIDAAVPGKRSADLITFVKDRLGHDRRYATDGSKFANELGWRPRETLESGLLKTVRWYVERRAWTDAAARRAA